ncbi:F0F1 ATP synthase subunit epsilon [Anaerocolumna sp. AGMB13025]|uniref:F0F1 ATP synthase subunit epsilon n=1 Tax=Anaerocolumna sp. AGMB13025 TaxID=3039116 RepID=UPI00241CAFFE|nr:F0F1 ATP synthase subunit epsilon [Anaerocolumna sp. AGMB13025]WFR59341.1 F0F1 ATP synthase subunit epsilon [Anaerocolumna sp. AGMB13025]
MAKTFQLEIIASDHPFYKGECEMLIFPGIDGEHGILARHEAMVTCINAGELRFLVDGTWNYAAVSAGFVEVASDYVVLLADTVERPEDIDINRANEAKMRAEERLRQKQSIMEYYHTQAALNRAMNRLKVTKRKSQ